ncbi:hypothetical protein ACFFU1_03195 [Algibacter miyuki]|uniref:DUF2383 domain-containing protein n=1 Tax=Algibacter miyuki TaxID=1306933 RepID=A0ABV5GW86_9FLAO|nr:hypothetical protein [Algibacter miyuki]MDN3665221.1 hypothetical protein [Algibacter miyuki]
MNKEINLKEIVDILTNQLKTIITIKSDFIALKNYEKAGIFRDYEKKIETQLEKIQGKKSIIKKTFPKEEQHVSKLNFSNNSKRILETISKENKIIFTKDLTINILNNLDSKLSDTLSNLSIELNVLKMNLINSSNKNDIPSKEHPLFSLKALKAIDTSFLEVKLTKEKEVTPSTILLSILRNKKDFTTKILNEHGITYEKLFTEIKKSQLTQKS